MNNNDEKGVGANTASSRPRWRCYVGWEEAWVCGEKGRREVHYFLKKKDGSKDLAVVGKEKSLRHMTYYYCYNNIRDAAAAAAATSHGVYDKHSFFLKLKSRREVINWLDSVIPVADVPSYRSLTQNMESFGNKDEQQLDLDDVKDVQTNKTRCNMSEFVWLGPSWTCRKKRKHYQSFRRNGVHIYVHDFVYVLAEEDKRLVAYLEDMYEDSRGNKMVVVRWFHKIDEVGIVLPHNYNDKEIFFSLCLQDLSIECIDGVATVLCPVHYEKFLKERRHTQLVPFVCHMLFENDDVKPFDITRVKGYWKQDILRYVSISSPSEDVLPDDGLKMDENHVDTLGSRPMKRLRKEADYQLQQPKRVKSGDANCSNMFTDTKDDVEKGNLNEGMVPSSYGKDAARQKHLHILTIGSQVEVLSQDSGIRGCWFRALIVKKHKDKVKVQYQDIKDAADESKSLEEWVSASRLAAPDECGIRVCGRTIVRPSQSKDGVPCGANVGSIVDAWWHNGWWEGILVKKESEDQLLVYFPGEKQEHAFGRCDLRYSLEWSGNRWNHIEDRLDLVPILSRHEPSKTAIQNPDTKQGPSLEDDEKDVTGRVHRDGLYGNNEVRCDSPGLDTGNKSGTCDLSKDDLLAQLRWKSLGKRRRGSRSPTHKTQYDSKKNGAVDTRMQTSERFLVRSSLKSDPDYCKYATDSHYSSSAVSRLTSLVMSR